MKQALSLVLMFAMMIASVPSAFGAGIVQEQLAAIPAGAKIEVHLKSNRTLRGAKGDVADSGFTLVNPGTGERQIAFSDVISVKLAKKSHTKRNVLIAAGIVVSVGVVVVVTFVVLAKTKTIPIV